MFFHTTCVYLMRRFPHFFYKLYNQKNPVLLPTVSDQARTDYDSVKDYFDAFLLKKPQGKIIEGKVNIGDSELRCHVGIVYALS